MTGELEPCPGCGVRLAAHEGPTHRYIGASPACWKVYGDLLAREYQDPAFRAVHRLTVDAYAVQHPGEPSPRSIRSVAVHLVALHLALERGMALERVTTAIGAVVRLGDLAWLEPPASRGATTALDVLTARDATEHAALVHAWARSAYAAWSPHHARVREWATGAGSGPITGPPSAP